VVTFRSEDPPILVEFEPSPGAYEVSLSSEDLAKKSAEALDRAMHTIRQMAQHVIATIDTLPRRPVQVEVDFGIVLNSEANALIAKVGVGATINVKLVLEPKEASDEEHTS
jgi:Trypsin-co-occurring domain 1